MQRDASITAIIPTRNRPRMVVAAVRSALAQTLAPVEVLVVIDGPDTTTAEALALLSVELGDDRLRVIALETSVGGAEARNVGVRSARSSWVAFLDDDDLWLPHKLAAQMEEAAASEAAAPVIGSAVIARGPRTETVWPRSLYQSGTAMAEYLFCREGWTFGAALLQTSTLFAPRDLLLRLPFTAGLRKHQDWDWLLRAADDAAVEVRQIAEPLAIFHVEGGRTSVGRLPDWQFSLRWAATNRSLFTPRAYAAFVATECAPQAAAAGASWVERFRLLQSVTLDSSCTPRLWLLCVAFLVIPRGLRHWIRERKPAHPLSPVLQSSTVAHPG